MKDKTQQRLNELESIIVREQDLLFRFAYMRVGRREDAEDIVQVSILESMSLARLNSQTERRKTSWSL